MRDLSILVPYKDVHITSITEGTIDVPDEVFSLVVDLCEEDGDDDWTFVLVKWFLVKNEEGHWD